MYCSYIYIYNLNLNKPHNYKIYKFINKIFFYGNYLFIEIYIIIYIYSQSPIFFIYNNNYISFVKVPKRRTINTKNH